MNHCVPDWIMEDNSSSFHDLLPTANQRKSTRPDHELVELLWQNGHVVMHSQTHRKTTSGLNESKQAHKPEPPLKSTRPFENSSSIIQGEETASWLQYSLDDSLEKEFCSDFFYGLPTTDSSAVDKLSSKDVVAEGGRFGKFGTAEESNVLAESVFKQSDRLSFEANTMAPPRSQVIGSIPETASADSDGVGKFSHFSRPAKSDLGQFNGNFVGKGLANSIQGEVGEPSSMMTKGSSNCGIDVTVASAKGAKEDARTKFSIGRAQTDAHEATVTSSSGGSGCSFGRTGDQSGSNKRHKRKGRDADESEYQSEDAGYESVEANRLAQQSASARRSRAAEVHNLSERRRRDRINEKMKALQELIPHCNKSDKASMLDEAIEYLKSLQLQVQLMWMGSGMAPMMFPGVQNYMSHMGMGMGHNPVHFARVPLVNQSMSSNPSANPSPMSPTPGLNPVNFPNQMPNARMPESYARNLGFHHMQPSPQGMMDLYTYGSQFVQRNQTSPSEGGVPYENIQHGKTG